jgi:hypothetical protein
MTSINSISSAILALPVNVEGNIFAKLSLPALGMCCSVSKAWNKMAGEHMKAFSHEKAFGPKEWFIHFGVHLRNVPRLPPNIVEILNAFCPFWPEKKVYETHVLVLAPETVNGQSLTLELLGELVKKPLIGNPSQYKGFALGEYTDPVALPPHWVLLTRDVIEGSRNQSYEAQQALIAECSQKAKVFCEVPKVRDVTICIFMEHVRSGTRLYPVNPYTWTRCQEMFDDESQVGIGCYASSGLHGNDNGGDSESSGVGGSWKF